MKKSLTFILSLMVTVVIFIFPVISHGATLSSSAGVVSVSSGNLNVRSAASTASSVISSLRKGTTVTLISKSGSWWKVEYANGTYGYCHSDYIDTVSSTAASVNITSGTLNLRSGPGTSYSRVGSLPRGKVVLVLSESNGWSRILYNGTKSAYVSSRYLSTDTTSSATAYSAVSLSVPRFKQTDSRWADVTLGSSGKTIRQVGCATTAISMIESYRAGYTIYPDAMSKRLSYTSSGNVYWPSDYTPVTSSSNYLYNIYQQLKLGKPVLFGVKNSYGGQHWVVITGYTGGSSLSTANFTINDPGSDTRTTLNQLFSAYPYFYKYFYYN